MPSEFDTLSTFSDWSSKLAEILAAARDAADNDARIGAARRLEEFMARSGPATPEIEALDRAAAESAKALARRALEDAVTGIASRFDSVSTQMSQLESIRAAASNARIAPASVGAALDRLSRLVAEARSLVPDSAANPGDSEALRVHIGRLLEALIEFQRTFGMPSEQIRN